MNDEFLTRHRKPPRREFSAALYERIQKPMNTPRNFNFRRFTLAAATCLAIGAALIASPNVRASMLFFFREIGGITFLEPDESSNLATETPGVERLVPEERVSLDDARAKLPFEIDLPTWAPDGFDMGSLVRISYFGDNNTPASITWYGSDPRVGNIDLIVGQPVQWVVDLDSLQEVKVNGESAALTGGGWDYDTGKWTGHDATLTWKRGDVMYILRSPGVPAEDLIRMAESIP